MSSARASSAGSWTPHTPQGCASSAGICRRSSTRPRDLRRAAGGRSLHDGRRRALRLDRARHRSERRAHGEAAEHAAPGRSPEALRAGVGDALCARRDRSIRSRHGAPPDVLARLSVRRAHALLRRLPTDGVLHVSRERSRSERPLRDAQRRTACVRRPATDVADAPRSAASRTSTGPGEAAGFMDAVARCGPTGYSLYDFPTTSSKGLEGACVAAAGPGCLRRRARRRRLG